MDLSNRRPREQEGGKKGENRGGDTKTLFQGGIEMVAYSSGGHGWRGPNSVQ